MAAICHLDTSGWNPEHPVRHFMPDAHLVFGGEEGSPTIRPAGYTHANNLSDSSRNANLKLLEI